MARRRLLIICFPCVSDTCDVSNFNAYTFQRGPPLTLTCNESKRYQEVVMAVVGSCALATGRSFPDQACLPRRLLKMAASRQEHSKPPLYLSSRMRHQIENESSSVLEPCARNRVQTSHNKTGTLCKAHFASKAFSRISKGYACHVWPLIADEGHIQFWKQESTFLDSELPLPGRFHESTRARR